MPNKAPLLCPVHDAIREAGAKEADCVANYLFALALEILTLGSPLLNQLVIDEVLVAADRSLLTVIIIALLLLSLTQMLLSLASQWASITLSVNFNMQWTARVFHHLVHLPLSWFDCRSKGSINARFEAVDTIQQALTTQVLEGILDVLLVLTALCMMLLYSPEMTLIAVLAAIIYGVLRLCGIPPSDSRQKMPGMQVPGNPGIFLKPSIGS